MEEPHGQDTPAERVGRVKKVKNEEGRAIDFIDTIDYDGKMD